MIEDVKDYDDAVELLKYAKKRKVSINIIDTIQELIGTFDLTSSYELNIWVNSNYEYTIAAHEYAAEWNPHDKEWQKVATNVGYVDDRMTLTPADVKSLMLDDDVDEWLSSDDFMTSFPNASKRILKWLNKLAAYEIKKVGD